MTTLFGVEKSTIGRARIGLIEPVIRVLEPEDVPLVDAMGDEMSPESMAQRFFVGTPRIPAALLRQLRSVDHVRQEAVLALAGGCAVGLAQYVCPSDSNCTAEVAVMVIDSWHRRGIGRRLMHELSALAATSGIVRFEASVLGDNLAARRLLASTWPTGRETTDGTELQYVLPLQVSRARACA